MSALSARANTRPRLFNSSLCEDVNSKNSSRASAEYNTRRSIADLVGATVHGRNHLTEGVVALREPRSLRFEEVLFRRDILKRECAVLPCLGYCKRTDAEPLSRITAASWRTPFARSMTWPLIVPD
jgi:hypothetical protein